jgi:hypothetical protein
MYSTRGQISDNSRLEITMVDRILLHCVTVITKKEVMRRRAHSPLAYKRVHSLAVPLEKTIHCKTLIDSVVKSTTRMNIPLPVSLAFQCFATLSASGSSGFGALRSA